MPDYQAEPYLEDGYTHYLNVGALHALFYRMWWRAYRPRLMAAYPWKLTWREYVDRYMFLYALDEVSQRALGTTRGPEGPPSRRGVSASPKSYSLPSPISGLGGHGETPRE